MSIEALTKLLVEECEPNTKTCPCGEVFHRGADESDKAWARLVYCPTHRKMSRYRCQQDVNRIRAENGREPYIKPVKNSTEQAKRVVKSSSTIKRVQGYTPKVETEIKAMKIDPVKEPDSGMEGITWRQCKECGKIFYRDPDQIDANWSRQDYCTVKCRKKVENRKKVQKRKAQRHALKVIPEKAQDVAGEKWGEVFNLIAPFVSDPKILLMLENTAKDVGARCYTQAVADIRGVA